MHFIAGAEITLTDWIPVIVEVIVALAAIFGGAGFWQYKQAKFQAKIAKESKESGIEKKVDTLTDVVTEITCKVDNLSDNLHDLKSDIELLQLANEETVKYRNARDNADKLALQERQAIIESLKGLIRERLLDVYSRCVKKGYYSKEEREVYKPLYECYTSDPFHGNGVMKDLHHIMVRLPMVPNGEPTEADKNIS